MKMELWRQRSEGEDLKKEIQSGRLWKSKKVWEAGEVWKTGKTLEGVKVGNVRKTPVV